MREYYTNGYVNKNSLAGYTVLIGLVFCLGGIGKYFSKDTKATPAKQHQVAESNLVNKVETKQ